MSFNEGSFPVLTSPGNENKRPKEETEVLQTAEKLMAKGSERERLGITIAGGLDPGREAELRRALDFEGMGFDDFNGIPESEAGEMVRLLDDFNYAVRGKRRDDLKRLICDKLAEYKDLQPA